MKEKPDDFERVFHNEKRDLEDLVQAFESFQLKATDFLPKNKLNINDRDYRLILHFPMFFQVGLVIDLKFVEDLFRLFETSKMICYHYLHKNWLTCSFNVTNASSTCIFQ